MDFYQFFSLRGATQNDIECIQDTIRLQDNENSFFFFYDHPIGFIGGRMDRAWR